MAMTRRQIRENIFRLVFDFDFCRESDREEQARMYFEKSCEEEMPNPPELAGEEEAELIARKAGMVAEMIPQLDDRLNRIARGWRTGRMARADLAILRLAVYEMFYDDEIPTGVAINEAVELAKRYGTDESPAFINGLLARLAREIPGDEK